MFLSRPWSFRLTDSQKNKKGCVSHDKGIRVGHRTQTVVLFHKVGDILYGTSWNASQLQDGFILIGLTLVGKITLISSVVLLCAEVQNLPLNNHTIHTHTRETRILHGSTKLPASMTKEQSRLVSFLLPLLRYKNSII